MKDFPLKVIPLLYVLITFQLLKLLKWESGISAIHCKILNFSTVVGLSKSMQLLLWSFLSKMEKCIVTVCMIYCVYPNISCPENIKTPFTNSICK